MYANELSFSCCSEFNLRPKFPSEAGDFWNNPHIICICPLVYLVYLQTNERTEIASIAVNSLS